MFSRSDTPDDSIEEESEKQRNPLILAGLAGLLAIAGAFLLVWYLRGDSTTSDVVADDLAALNQTEVLIVTADIPRGTTVKMINDSPNSYFRSELAPDAVVPPRAIVDIAQLAQLEPQWILKAPKLAGTMILTDDFIDQATFDNPSFSAQNSPVPPPEGHHEVVIPVGTRNALGSVIRPGDTVTVVGNFLVREPDGDTFTVSVVVLPTIEVTRAEINAEIVGNPELNTSELGGATVGELVITVAVEPDELTQLTYALEYATSIILASALPGADRDDIRAASTLGTLLSEDVELVTDENADFLGLVSVSDETDNEDPNAADGDPEPEDADEDS